MGLRESAPRLATPKYARTPCRVWGPRGPYFSEVIFLGTECTKLSYSYSRRRALPKGGATPPTPSRFGRAKPNP